MSSFTLDPIQQMKSQSVELQTFDVLPEAEAERRRLGRWFKRADFQATGLFAIRYFGRLTVSLEGSLPSGVEISICVGDPGYGPPEETGDDFSIFPLEGNSVELPNGVQGTVWVRAVHAGEQVLPKAVTLAFTKTPFVISVPTYRHGETSASEWRRRLEDFSLFNDVIPAQLISDRVIISAWPSTALAFADHDMSRVLDEYARILTCESAIAQIGPDLEQTPESVLRILVAEKASGNPNAGNYRISLPRYGREFLTVEGLRESWGVWHELGHIQQQIAWMAQALVENSVNIYSLAVQRMYQQPSRVVPYDAQAHLFLADASPDKRIEDCDEFVRLVMWEQFRAVYGEAFFHRLHDESRRTGNSDLFQGDAQYRHYFMVLCSQTAREDLSLFFQRWGLHPTPATLKAIADLNLPKPRLEPSSVHLFDATYIRSAYFTGEGMVVITGTAHPGSRLKTTSDPQQGWYDPEEGIVHAGSDGLFTLRTRRLVNGAVVVKSFDARSGDGLSESKPYPLSVSSAPLHDAQALTGCTPSP